MRRAAVFFAGLIAAGVVAIPAAQADTVTLRNGNVLHGEIVEESADTIKMVVRGGLMTLSRSSVIEIVRETARAPRGPALPDISEAGLAPFFERGDLAGAAKRVGQVAAHDLPRLNRLAQRVAGLWVAAGEQARRRQDHQAAAAAFERALSWWPLWDRALERKFLDAAVTDVRLRLLEAGDIDAATVRLQELRDVFPDDPVVAWLAGRAAEASGRPADARRAYADVLGIAPDGPALDDLRTRATAAAAAGVPAAGRVDWHRAPLAAPAQLAGQGFRIAHVNEPAARRVARTLAWHLARQQAALGAAATRFPPPGPIEIDLRAAATLRESGEPWAAGRAITTFVKGAIRSERIWLLQDTPQLLSAAIPHELAHLMLARAIGPAGRLPKALNEGFACRFEPAWKRAWYGRVWAAARTDRPRMAVLLRARGYPPEERIPVFYSGSLVLVGRLLERGTMQRFLRFCEACQYGDPVAALREFYDCTPDALEE